MVDIHTHNLNSSNYKKVVNCSTHNLVEFENQPYFSAGIHPWYLNDIENQKLKLFELAVQKNCMAIGECGLDSACNSPMDLQKSTFIFACDLAQKLNKPMIIHCVKAHFETIKILKDHGIKKAIFHGFNNRYTILEKILQEGYLVSFGEAILNIKSQAFALLKSVPLDKLFLETDDSSHTIETIYQSATSILELNMQDLIKQQEINFKNFIA